MSNLIRWASLLGLTASFYALYVEFELQDAAMKGTQYTAACDTTWASCSKVLSSKYAHILSAWGLVEKGSTFDLSNAIMGAAYYALALVLAGSRSPAAKNVLLAASFGSLCFSFYLAYILKFVLNDTCIVCISMYVATILCFIGAARRILVDGKVTAKKVAGKEH